MFPSSSLPPQSVSSPGLSTTILQSCSSFPFGHSPLVAPQPDSSGLLISSHVAPDKSSSSLVSPVVPLSNKASNLPTHPMITRAKAKQISLTSPYALVSSLEPHSAQEALLDPNWTKAMEEEYSALLRNQTWDLVPFSSDMNIIGCKWVFRIKYNPDGSLLKYKARLVAKGFLQTPGIDFAETFSPVVKALIIRVLFSLVVTYSWIFSKLI